MAKGKEFDADDRKVVKEFCLARLQQVPMLQKVYDFLEQSEPFSELLADLQSQADRLQAKIAAEEKALAVIVNAKNTEQAELERIRKELSFAKAEIKKSQDFISGLREKEESHV